MNTEDIVIANGDIILHAGREDVRTIKTSEGLFLGCTSSDWRLSTPRWADQNGRLVTGRISTGVFLGGKFTSNEALEEIKLWSRSIDSKTISELFKTQDVSPEHVVINVCENVIP